MKSTFHSGLSKTALLIIPRGRCLAIAAALTTLRIGSVFAQEYDEMNVVPLDDYFDVPTPSIDEYVSIGGFQLRVDQTKWAIDLTPNNHGLLARLQGHNVDINVIEIPRSQSLNQIAEKHGVNKGFISPYRTCFYKPRYPRRKGRLRRKAISLQTEYPGDSLLLRKSRGRNDLFRGTCENFQSRLVRRKLSCAKHIVSCETHTRLSSQDSAADAVSASARRNDSKTGSVHLSRRTRLDAPSHRRGAIRQETPCKAPPSDGRQAIRLFKKSGTFPPRRIFRPARRRSINACHAKG